MPFVQINRMPAGIKNIHFLVARIQEGLAGLKELKIVPEQVEVSIPSDQNHIGLGKKYVVIVPDFFKKPERTKDVRDKVADIIKEIIRQYVLDEKLSCELIDVYVGEFDESKGGHTSYKF